MRKSLVISEPGSELALHQGRFVVRIGQNIARRIRVTEIDQIVLLGNIAVTPDAMAVALRRDIDLALLTPRGGFRGRLSSGRGMRAELTLAQYRMVADDGRRRRVAASMVAGKIANQRRVLVRYQAQLKDDLLAESLTGMRHMLRRCQVAESLDQLRGFEGQAAALYWRGFGRVISNPDLSFCRRTFRPPLDPVNACLSFCYSLLATTCDSVIRLVGMEPGLGFLHDAAGHRPSVALDLMEEFRPVVVDRVVLGLVNRRQLACDDFEIPELEHYLAEEGETGADYPDAELDGNGDGPPPGVGAAASGLSAVLTAPVATPAGDEGSSRGGTKRRVPIHLTATGRNVVLHALYARLREPVLYPPLGTARSLRDIIELQARHLARHILGEDEQYIPFVPR